LPLYEICLYGYENSYKVILYHKKNLSEDDLYKMFLKSLLKVVIREKKKHAIPPVSVELWSVIDEVIKDMLSTQGFSAVKIKERLSFFSWLNLLNKYMWYREQQDMDKRLLNDVSNALSGDKSNFRSSTLKDLIKNVRKCSKKIGFLL